MNDLKPSTKSIIELLELCSEQMRKKEAHGIAITMTLAADRLKALIEMSTDKLELDIAANRLEKMSESEALKALRYLMDRFDNENWQCPKCGCAESTSTMDSAYWLRDWFERVLK